MNKLNLIILCVISCLLFTSCNDDGYSLGEFRVEMATATSLDESAFYLTLDSGEKLWISAPLHVRAPKTERVFINYTLLSDEFSGYDHAIKLNGMSEILTKDIAYADPLDQQVQDSIGNDPIDIISLWSGGEFINAKVAYNFGEVNRHMLNIISAQEIESIDISNPIKLEFRHNKYDDPERYKVGSYACFSIKPFIEKAKAANLTELNFEISSTDYKGIVQTYNIKYTVR